MERIDSVVSILNDAEIKGLKAIAEAANDADLASLDKARLLVERIRELKSEFAEQSAKPIAKPRQPSRRQSKGKPKSKVDAYPRYSIRGQTLYRTAWSRKKNNEYEHKAAKKTVELVARAMKESATSDDGAVAVEKIVATIDRIGSVQIPQYQVYMVIGWLRDVGQIEQIGREGYRIPPEIVKVVADEWQRLSSVQN